ncbi:MAG: site-specific DNA-methyltransferase [Ignavibacteriales bacterium]|nr:site-specific DNA-methyltransferase [Ignavibacteriales bacterium]
MKQGPLILLGDCRKFLEPKLFEEKTSKKVDLTFLDPPFNQDKEYAEWDDDLPEDEYWRHMQEVCSKVSEITRTGGSIYFMQREKNAEQVLRCLRESGWVFQNLIIWKKKTSAIPGIYRYGKHYQIIAFATKGKRARVFHRLRIDPPLPKGYKYEREDGMYVTDVWDDIRELTSGYFSGDEALRDKNGNRQHKQQSPIQLLIRIILSSTKPGDVVLDPFAGTGTTLVVAHQLQRIGIGVELDKANVRLIQKRLEVERDADNILKFLKSYECTPDLKDIWPLPNYETEIIPDRKNRKKQQTLSKLKHYRLLARTG